MRLRLPGRVIAGNRTPRAASRKEKDQPVKSYGHFPRGGAEARKNKNILSFPRKREPSACNFRKLCFHAGLLFRAACTLYPRSEGATQAVAGSRVPAFGGMTLLIRAVAVLAAFCFALVAPAYAAETPAKHDMVAAANPYAVDAGL